MILSATLLLAKCFYLINFSTSYDKILFSLNFVMDNAITYIIIISVHIKLHINFFTKSKTNLLILSEKNLVLMGKITEQNKLYNM
jgi:hypothetical protein